LVSFPAYAFDSNAKTPDEQTALANFGEAYLQVAKKFGCNAFVRASVLEEGRNMQMEYAPDGADIDMSPRAFTVTIYLLTGDTEADKGWMAIIQETIVNTYMKAGEIVKVETVDNSMGEPETYIEYMVVNKKGMAEHNAGVVVRTSEQTAAFMQVKSRERSIKPEMAKQIHDMLGKN